MLKRLDGNAATRGAAVLLCLLAVETTVARARNIMLTGYWPQTNNMLRRFSPNPEQNPDGWIGENWMGRGYNVYAFFPEFEDENDPGKGEGDFEVDYQDTSQDWWRITDEIDPVALITFSRGNNDKSWEIEWRQRNLRTWIDDYEAPYQPTPSPPDDSQRAGFVRYSSLPMEEIRKAVNDANLGVNAYIDRTGYGGGFLSEFIAYHGTWYRDIHQDKSDPAWTIAAGHIHVGSRVTKEVGAQAVDVTLDTLLDYVDTIIPEPATGFAAIILMFIARRRR